MARDQHVYENVGHPIFVKTVLHLVFRKSTGLLLWMKNNGLVLTFFKELFTPLDIDHFYLFSP